MARISWCAPAMLQRTQAAPRGVSGNAFDFTKQSVALLGAT